MTNTSVRAAVGSAAALLDALAVQQQQVAAAQAELAAMVVAFADLRVTDDEADFPPDPTRPGRQRPGEFVADEVSLALRIPLRHAQLLLARSRRLRAGLPTVWAAGLAGRLDELRLIRIDRAARLVLDPVVLSVLDETVVDVAAAKTVTQLDSWLQRFLAEHEPAAYTHRHQVTYADRNVSAVPALHGVGYVSALVSAPDLYLIDARLDALARACGAADPRTLGQRRADLFADLLLDRIEVSHPADTAHVTTCADAPGGGVGQPEVDLTGVEMVEVEMIDPDTGEYLGTRIQGIDTKGEPVDAPGAPRTVLRPREGVPATIGVIVPLSTLTGETDRPGLLADRSACLPPDQVREMATQPGTLFYRLLTDPQGHLLDVTRVGRFATGQLGLAVRLRAGACGFPTCTVPADRCDLDHHEPAPDGPTTAANLDPASRRHHRAKTHAGFHSWRDRHETFWTTPTGHTYRCLDEPLG